MEKVYLKGFERPHAVFGIFLFEDERNRVLGVDGRRIKIPLGNILYVEDISWTPFAEVEAPDLEAAQLPNKDGGNKPGPAPQNAAGLNKAQIQAQKRPAQLPEKTNISVNFVGHKAKAFSIDVPTPILDGKVAELTKLIYSDPQVKSFLGDFQMQGLPVIDGTNVIITTVPLQQKPNMDMAKDKLEATKKLLSTLAPKMPSLGIDTSFSMPGSPFTTPMNLQDFDENQ